MERLVAEFDSRLPRHRLEAVVAPASRTGGGSGAGPAPSSSNDSPVGGCSIPVESGQLAVP
ncbi:hypothetical protein N505_0121365 [Rhodococcus aetherivorans]|nr:hypothetical protein N505_0121365 [Rhodococcus aetherivorans]